MNKGMFLFANLIAAMFDIGLIIMGVGMNLEVVQVIALGLSFHLGGCVPYPVRLSGKVVRLVGIIGTGLLCFYISDTDYLLLFFGCFMLSVVIHYLMDASDYVFDKHNGRIIKIIGYLFGLFMNKYILVILGFVLIYQLFRTKEKRQVFGIMKVQARFIDFILLVHQIHHYCYCYFVVFLIAGVFSGTVNFVIGILFSLGWLTYTYLPEVIKGHNYKVIFIVGHITLAFLILFLSKAQGVGIIFFWMMTGFGRGTGYGIRRIAKREFGYQTDTTLVFDSISRPLGIVVGIIVYVLCNYNLRAPIGVGSGLALFAAGCMIYYVTKIQRNVYER